MSATATASRSARTSPPSSRRGVAVRQPERRPATGSGSAGPRRPVRELLARLRSHYRPGPAIATAVILGLLGFVIGLSVGRPDWPAEGSADVGFARDMASHHAQAVEMGMIAVQKATNDEVRSLGHDIATTQQAQIGLMHGWLDTWGVPRTSPDLPMAWVPGGVDMLNGNLMPGMATREEINELMSATGEQVDILFLQLMIRHHLGGVHMVEALLAQDPSPPVRALAEQMARNQGAEVVLMKDLLAEFGASPLPS